MSDATPETQIDESAAIEYASAKLEEAMAGRGLALMGTPAILHSPDGIYGRAFGAKRLPVADAVFVVELFYQNSSVGGRWISEGTMALNPEIVRDLTKLARTPRK